MKIKIKKETISINPELFKDAKVSFSYKGRRVSITPTEGDKEISAPLKTWMKAINKSEDATFDELTQIKAKFKDLRKEGYRSKSKTPLKEEYFPVRVIARILHRLSKSSYKKEMKSIEQKRSKLVPFVTVPFLQAKEPRKLDLSSSEESLPKPPKAKEPRRLDLSSSEESSASRVKKKKAFIPAPGIKTLKIDDDGKVNPGKSQVGDIIVKYEKGQVEGELQITRGAEKLSFEQLTDKQRAAILKIINE